MPEDQAPPSIGEQLARALLDADVSQKELARRLAGTADFNKVESKRRWLAKIEEGRIKRPGMAAVERALSLPRGHFRFPTPQQVQQRKDRLEELATEVANLRKEHVAFVREVSEWRAAQEIRFQELATQQSAQTSKRQEEEAS